MTGLAVSFSSPVGLLALLSIPVVVALWWSSRARARKTAIRFPAAGVLAAAGGRYDWGRFVAGALAIAALASLSLALAKPVKAVRVPIEQASIVLVTDHSGSMAATDVSPSRLGAAQGAAQTFIDQLPKAVRLGAVTFAEAPDVLEPPSTNHNAVRAVIDDQIADGGTATGDALQAALNLLLAGNKNADLSKHPPAAIVLLSDGKSSENTTDPLIIAERAAQAKVPIYTVALGTPEGVLPDPYDPAGGQSVPPDPETLRQISKITHGKAFEVSDGDRLKQIYKELGSQLGTKKVEKQVTQGFAIGGLVLLLAAALASVLTAGRLP